MIAMIRIAPKVDTFGQHPLFRRAAMEATAEVSTELRMLRTPGGISWSLLDAVTHATNGQGTMKSGAWRCARLSDSDWEAAVLLLDDTRNSGGCISPALNWV